MLLFHIIFYFKLFLLFSKVWMSQLRPNSVLSKSATKTAGILLNRTSKEQEAKNVETPVQIFRPRQNY